MKYARWYPTMVTQPDGTILTFSGSPRWSSRYYPERHRGLHPNERQIERFDPATGKWTNLPSSANKSLPLFPRMTCCPTAARSSTPRPGRQPDGLRGDQATWNFVSAFDPKTNSWTDLGVNDFGGVPLGFRGLGLSMMLTLSPATPQLEFLSSAAFRSTWPGGYFGCRPRRSPRSGPAQQLLLTAAVRCIPRAGTTTASCCPPARSTSSTAPTATTCPTRASTSRTGRPSCGTRRPSRGRRPRPRHTAAPTTGPRC